MWSLHRFTLGAAFSFILSAMAAAQPATNGPRTSPLDVPVADMEVVAPDVYGSASSLAAGGGSPLDIALAIVGDFEGTTQHIVQTNEGGEVPSATKIAVLRDGLLDDSVRGERWDIALTRTGAGAWAIREVKRSWRCRRGEHTDRFAAQRCP